MRINADSCRQILIVVERDDNAGSGKGVCIATDGYDAKEIAHHVKYLLDDGRITGHDCTHMQSPYPEITVTDKTLQAEDTWMGQNRNRRVERLVFRRFGDALA